MENSLTDDNKILGRSDVEILDEAIGQVGSMGGRIDAESRPLLLTRFVPVSWFSSASQTGAKLGAKFTRRTEYINKIEISDDSKNISSKIQDIAKKIGGAKILEIEENKIVILTHSGIQNLNPVILRFKLYQTSNGTLIEIVGIAKEGLINQSTSMKAVTTFIQFLKTDTKIEDIKPTNIESRSLYVMGFTFGILSLLGIFSSYVGITSGISGLVLGRKILQTNTNNKIAFWVLGLSMLGLLLSFIKRG